MAGFLSMLREVVDRLDFRQRADVRRLLDLDPGLYWFRGLVAPRSTDPPSRMYFPQRGQGGGRMYLLSLRKWVDKEEELTRGDYGEEDVALPCFL